MLKLKAIEELTGRNFDPGWNLLGKVRPSEMQTNRKTNLIKDRFILDGIQNATKLTTTMKRKSNVNDSYTIRQLQHSRMCLPAIITEKIIPKIVYRITTKKSTILKPCVIFATQENYFLLKNILVFSGYVI